MLFLYFFINFWLQVLVVELIDLAVDYLLNLVHLLGAEKNSIGEFEVAALFRNLTKDFIIFCRASLSLAFVQDVRVIYCSAFQHAVFDSLVLYFFGDHRFKLAG